MIRGGKMPEDKLFRLETRHQILMMKAIHRFIRKNDMTIRMVLDRYLSDEEKTKLKELDKQIIEESLIPFMDEEEQK